MTVVETDRALRGPTWRTAAAPVLLAPVALAIIVITGLMGSATVAHHHGLARVGFGRPLGWLIQDQRALDPPLPERVTFISPWDNPTHVALVPLALDLLLVYGVLLLGMVVSRAFTARRRGAAG